MDRTCPRSDDYVCDRCGTKGATDFMGDYFCYDCLETDDEGHVKVKDGYPED